MRKRSALDAEIQRAVTGYQINMMDIPKVYKAGEDAQAKGQNVTEAVRALLDVIAVKVG